MKVLNVIAFLCVSFFVNAKECKNDTIPATMKMDRFASQLAEVKEALKKECRL